MNLVSGFSIFRKVERGVTVDELQPNREYAEMTLVAMANTWNALAGVAFEVELISLYLHAKWLQMMDCSFPHLYV